MVFLKTHRETSSRHRQAALVGQALHDAAPRLPRGARHQHRPSLGRPGGAAGGGGAGDGEEGTQQGTPGQLLAKGWKLRKLMKI